MRFADIKKNDINLEDFKSPLGFEDYLVSKEGLIYSLKRNKLMKPFKDSKGYLQIHLFQNGKRVSMKVHILVAKLFVDNPYNKPCVNHLDGDKSNPHYLNLEWCTHKENTQHALAHELKHTFANNLKDEVAVCQYTKDGELIQRFDSMQQASKLTNTPQPNISKVCKGERKTANSFIWRYE